MPQPIKYAGGYAVNFRMGARRIRARFPAARYPNPKLAAEEFIRRALEADPEDSSSDLALRIREYLNYAERIQNKSPKTLRGDGGLIFWPAILRGRSILNFLCTFSGHDFPAHLLPSRAMHPG